MLKSRCAPLLTSLLAVPLIAWGGTPSFDDVVNTAAGQETEDKNQQSSNQQTETEEAPVGSAEASSNGSGIDEGEEGHDTFNLRWQNFIDAAQSLVHWELFDGRLSIRGGVGLQIDGTAGKASDLLKQSIGEIDGSIDLRRFRVFAQGTFDEHLRFKASIDLGADAGIKDVYVEGIDKGLSVWGYDIGNFRLGSFGEPFSMERRTSRNSLIFLERSLPVWTFAPGRNVGYMLHDTAKNERISWQAGFFSLGNKDEDNASASTLSITGRITWLPIYKDEGRTLLHLGISYSSRDPRSNEVQYRSRPEARFVPFIVDTGPIDSNKIHLTGVEFAYKTGQWWTHSEWIQATVESTLQGDPKFWRAFVQAGYFFTGENRPYHQTDGTWGRVDPILGYDTGIPIRERSPLRKGSGGAFEIAGRISTLDLNSGLVEGGELTNFSVGLSWYSTRATRWLCDYIYSSVKDGGNANIVMLRFQYSFY